MNQHYIPISSSIKNSNFQNINKTTNFSFIYQPNPQQVRGINN